MLGIETIFITFCALSEAKGMDINMTRTDVFQKLNTIFRQNFDDEGIILAENTSSADIEDWDSLEQINLIVAIQDEFKVKFNIDEVNAMKHVGEMVDFILEKIGD